MSGYPETDSTLPQSLYSAEDYVGKLGADDWMTMVH